MARHGRGKGKYRKYNSRFQVLPVKTSIALLTLGNNTAITSSITALSDDFWVQSADLTWTLTFATPGEGPLMVGLNNGDLTATEIKEALEALPSSRSDIVNRERARRPVRKVGQFTSLLGSEVLNDGQKVRTTIKMYLAEGVELEAFVFNASGAALTTGTFVDLYGNLYGEWR